MAPLIQFSSAAALDCKRNLDPPLSFTAFKTLHIITCGKRRLELRTCNSFIEVIELQRSGFVRAWSLHSPASFKEIRWRRSNKVKRMAREVDGVARARLPGVGRQKTSFKIIGVPDFLGTYPNPG